MSMTPAVMVTRLTERPTAVVAATTTWRDFPAQWKPMLDQVYACLRRHGDPGQGCNIMLERRVRRGQGPSTRATPRRPDSSSALQRSAGLKAMP